jgi:D-amino peptidase
MRIFITTDLEGVSGALHPEHTSWDGRSHADARRWLTNEVNAAITASYECGATEVLVLDGHSNGRSIVLDALHPDAQLMWGRQNRRLGQVEGLERGFDALLMVGYHGRAGVPGVVNHTINLGIVSEIRANGEPIGEIDINAALAGELEVPVAMVSGDAAAVEQALARMPGIETATTMVAVGAYSAKIVSPQRSCELIHDAVVRGLERLSEMTPVTFATPLHLEVQFKDTAMADAAAMIPTVERIDGTTCALVSDATINAYPALWAMITLAVSERWDRTV